jgi:hypothetical protein
VRAAPGLRRTGLRAGPVRDSHMALTATMYHLQVALSDGDRGVYEALDLRLARHEPTRHTARAASPHLRRSRAGDAGMA